MKCLTKLYHDKPIEKQATYGFFQSLLFLNIDSLHKLTQIIKIVFVTLSQILTMSSYCPRKLQCPSLFHGLSNDINIIITNRSYIYSLTT